MNKVKTLGNTLLVFGLVNSGISHLDAALLPVETFFKTPRYLQASLSPNGQHVGFIGFLNDSYDLFTLNLNTKRFMVLEQEWVSMFGGIIGQITKI